MTKDAVVAFCAPDGQNRLPEIIRGVEFRDGIKHGIKAA
jgi:hypothetical protein